MTVKFSDLKVGTRVQGRIRGRFFDDGKIQIEGSRFYICQNVRAGSSCNDKLGYDYSWCIDLPTDDRSLLRCLEINSVANLVAIRDTKYHHKIIRLGGTLYRLVKIKES